MKAIQCSYGAMQRTLGGMPSRVENIDVEHDECWVKVKEF